MTDDERAREIARCGTHTHVAGTTAGLHIDQCAQCGGDIRAHNAFGQTLEDRIAAALAEVRREEREIAARYIGGLAFQMADGETVCIGRDHFRQWAAEIRIAAAIRAGEES